MQNVVVDRQDVFESSSTFVESANIMRSPWTIVLIQMSLCLLIAGFGHLLAPEGLIAIVSYCWVYDPVLAGPLIRHRNFLPSCERL